MKAVYDSTSAWYVDGDRYENQFHLKPTANETAVHALQFEIIRC